MSLKYLLPITGAIAGTGAAVGAASAPKGRRKKAARSGALYSLFVGPVTAGIGGAAYQHGVVRGKKLQKRAKRRSVKRKTTKRRRRR